MGISSEALVGFAAFLEIGLWEIWASLTRLLNASFGWRWAKPYLILYGSGGYAVGIASIYQSDRTGLAHPDCPTRRISR